MKRMHSIELFCSGEYDANIHQFVLDKDLQPGRYYFEYSLDDDYRYCYCGFINIRVDADAHTDCRSTPIIDYDTEEIAWLSFNTDGQQNVISFYMNGSYPSEGYDNQIITFYRIS